MGEALQRAPAATPVHYERRRPEETTLYRLVQENLETFLAQVETESGSGLPEFLRLRCRECGHEKLVAF